MLEKPAPLRGRLLPYPLWAAIDDGKVSLRLVVPRPVVLAGDVEPDFDLFVFLTRPYSDGVYSDRVIHRLVSANDRPKIWRNRDLGHVFCTLDNQVANLHVGGPIGFLAAVVL